MKWLFALERGSGPARTRPAGRCTAFVAEPFDALIAWTFSREPRPSRADGVIACFRDDPADAPAPPRAHGYRVDEVVHWDDGGGAPGESSSGVVVFYFLRRREDLSQAEFVRRYRDHAPLAREHHPGVARYVQNYVVAASPGAPEWHAIAELHFRGDADLRARFYRDEQSPKLVAEDVTRFAAPRSGFALVTRPGQVT